MDPDETICNVSLAPPLKSIVYINPEPPALFTVTDAPPDC